MPTIIHRDTTTGRIVTAAHAKANPNTTTREVRRASELRRLLTKAEDVAHRIRELTAEPRVPMSESSGHARLRSLAEACPPEDVNSGWYSEGRLSDAIVTDDRAFVAACSPTVVLGLLDRIAELEELVEVEYAGRNRLAAIVREVRTHCAEVAEESEAAAYVLSLLDGDTGGDHDDANSNSKPPLGVGLEPIAFDPPLTEDEAGAFLDAITTDEADQ